MLRKAVSICDAKFGTLYFREGDRLRLIATHEVPPALAEAQGKAPFRPVPDGMLDAVMRTGRTVHLADLAQARSYSERDPRIVEAVEIGGIRSVVGVPLIKDDELIGLIGIYRQEVRPFAAKQIEVLTNFAAQAVIAIENARLLNELRQSLEQQTATSDVLRVISSSPGALEPVFKALLENATRLCGASYGNMWLCEGDAFRSVALHGVFPATYMERWGTGALFRPEPDVPLAQTAKTRRPFQIADIRESQLYRDGNPIALSVVNDAGMLAVLAVPMLKENDLVGAIAIHSKEARPFTDKQIELLENFASQAVIAIETRDCSANCANRYSSRPLPPTCSRSSAALHSICRLC